MTLESCATVRVTEIQHISQTFIRHCKCVAVKSEITGQENLENKNAEQTDCVGCKCRWYCIVVSHIYISVENYTEMMHDVRLATDGESEQR